MNRNDQRPPFGVAHVVLKADAGVLVASCGLRAKERHVV
jgi:hypothetical protein